jgi:hypothetical protein
MDLNLRKKTRDEALMDLINGCIANTRGHGDAFDIATPLSKITRKLSKMIEILEDKK